MSSLEYLEEDPRIPSPATDRRHDPGEGALPLWHENFWFPFYDPERDLGVVVRFGLFPCLGSGTSKFYVAIFRGGETVYLSNHQRAPLPAQKSGRLALYNGLALEWLEPLRSFRLFFKDGDIGFDLTFTGMSAPFLYDSWRHGPPEVAPRHIEQGGRAQGTITIDGRTHPFDGLAHRDHTFGGERDWNRLYRWNCFSGEFDRFWFNAVRSKFDADTNWLSAGCLFNGERVLALKEIDITVRTVQGGSRPVSATLALTDETGKTYRLETGSFHGVCPVLIGRTWVKDHIVQYRMGSAAGYGVLEHGYRDDDRLLEFEIEE